MTTYDPDDMLTTAQCAKEAHHHPRTIRNWIADGILVARRSPSKRGKFLIRYAELLKTLEQKENPKDGD